MAEILVLCTGNACRSQMAEGFLRSYLPPEFGVYSAGIEKHGLNRLAVKTMHEIGIDISEHRSKTIEELPSNSFDYVLTVCDNARENCPYFPAVKKTFHKGFKDPAKAIGNEDEVLLSFRKSRDEIGKYCRDLADELTSV